MAECAYEMAADAVIYPCYRFIEAYGIVLDKKKLKTRFFSPRRAPNTLFKFARIPHNAHVHAHAGNRAN